MEKYLIAVIRPNLEFCTRDADELKVRLADDGIHAKWFRNGNYVYVQTSHGTVEFIPSTALDDKRSIKSHITGKRYTKLFGILYIPEELRGYVKSCTEFSNYISWVVEKEKEYSTYTRLLCEQCKNFPICAIKEEYATTQSIINSAMNTSEHFKKAKLECEYFVSNSPIFPCGCV